MLSPAKEWAVTRGLRAQYRAKARLEDKHPSRAINKKTMFRPMLC
jgi:hypothetical protein